MTQANNPAKKAHEKARSATCYSATVQLTTIPEPKNLFIFIYIIYNIYKYKTNSPTSNS